MTTILAFKRLFKRALSIGFILCISFGMLTSQGCGKSAPRAAPTPPPASVAKVKEFFMNENLDGFAANGQPFVTGANITKIMFSRGYALQDADGNFVKVDGINIYEKVFINVNNNSGFTINTVGVNSTSTSGGGTFGDQPALDYGNGAPAAFEFQLTRIFYVKRNGNKVAIGGNHYTYKREAGDGAAAVRTKSVMAPVYFPTSIDDIQGRPNLGSKDSGD